MIGGVANLGSMVYSIKATNTQFKSAMRENRQEIESLNNKAKDGSRALKMWGAAITATAVAVAGATVNMAKNFEYEMAQVHTLLGPGTDERLRELSDSVKRVSMSTGKDLSDLAQGAYQVVSAFGDTADTARILETAAKAATAGISSTNEAIELLSAVTKGYGDVSAEMVETVSDLAFTTVRLGQTTFPELAGSIGRVTPLAATLNVQVEELFGSFATLTGVTGNAAEVSTQLRGILQGMLSPTEDLRKVMNELGYESGEAMIEALGLHGSLLAIYEAAGFNNEALGDMFSNIRALTGIIPLVNSQSDEMTRKTNEMYESTGAADEAFKTMQQTLQGSIERIKAFVAVVLTDVGDRFLPTIADAARKFADMDEEARQFWSTVIGLGTALGLIVGPLMLIVGYLPKILSGLRLIGAAMVFLKAQFLPFTVGGAVLIGLGILIKRITDARREVEELGGAALITTEQIRQMTDMTALAQGRGYLGMDITSMLREANEEAKEHQELLDELMGYFVEGLEARGFSPDIIDAYVRELTQALEEGTYDLSWATLGVPEHLFNKMAEMSQGATTEISQHWKDLSEEQQEGLLKLYPQADLAFSRLSRTQREHLLTMLEQWTATGEAMEEVEKGKQEEVEKTTETTKSLSEELKEIDKQLERLRAEAELKGLDFDEELVKVTLLRERINELLDEDMDIGDPVLRGLGQQIKDILQEAEEEFRGIITDEMDPGDYQPAVENYSRRIFEIQREMAAAVELGEIDPETYLWFLEINLENTKLNYVERLRLKREFDRMMEELEEESQEEIKRIRIQSWEEMDEKDQENAEELLQRRRSLYTAQITLGELELDNYMRFLTLQLDRDKLSAETRASVHSELTNLLQSNIRSLTEESNRRYESEEARIRWLKQRLEELAEKYKEQEFMVAIIEDAIRSLKVTTEETFEEMISQTELAFEQIGEVAEREMSRAFMDIVNNAKSATDAITGFFDAMARSIVQSMADALAERAVQQLLALIIGGGPTISFGGGGGGPIVRTAHSGGLLTHAGVIQSASLRMKPDEMLIKGQVGERILDRDETRDYDGGRSSGGTVIINTLDTKTIAEMLEEQKENIGNIAVREIQDHAVLREVLRRLGQ